MCVCSERDSGGSRSGEGRGRGLGEKALSLTGLNVFSFPYKGEGRRGHIVKYIGMFHR